VPRRQGSSPNPEHCLGLEIADELRLASQGLAPPPEVMERTFGDPDEWMLEVTSRSTMELPTAGHRTVYGSAERPHHDQNTDGRDRSAPVAGASGIDSVIFGCCFIIRFMTDEKISQPLRRAQNDRRRLSFHPIQKRRRNVQKLSYGRHWSVDYRSKRVHFRSLGCVATRTPERRRSLCECFARCLNKRD
jgi:hypothetical protein